MEQKKLFTVKDGQVRFDFEAKHDGDADGEVSAGAGAYMYAKVGELLEEIGKSKDAASLKAIAVFVKGFEGSLPDIEKEL